MLRVALPLRAAGGGAAPGAGGDRAASGAAAAGGADRATGGGGDEPTGAGGDTAGGGAGEATGGGGAEAAGGGGASVLKALGASFSSVGRAAPFFGRRVSGSGAAATSSFLPAPMLRSPRTATAPLALCRPSTTSVARSGSPATPRKDSSRLSRNASSPRLSMMRGPCAARSTRARRSVRTPPP